MPDRSIAPLGAPTWIDLATSDLDSAKGFYSTVFGWTFEDTGPEYGGYVTARLDGHPVAGLMPNDPQWNAPDGWSTYLHTADAEATVAAATAAGGTSCGATMDIPGKGRMAMLTDPAGAVFGVWEPAGHNGFEIVNAAGAPDWHQLTTADYTGALHFYRTVFGWDIRTEAETPEFRYSNAFFDGEPLLGVMDGAAFGGPSQWNFFLGADDVDKSVQLVTDNGGAVLRAAEDTPYGRLAAVADPTGAAFNLSSIPRPQ